MIILGIDPGNVESAFVLWDSINQIIEFAKIDNNISIITRNGVFVDVDQTCIEMIASYGMPVGKTVFDTCVWIGRFYQALSNTSPVDLIYRGAIKMHFCNSMKAKDSNIRQTLIDIFGPPGTKKNPGRLYGIKKDLWQALALCVYWAGKK